MMLKASRLKLAVEEAGEAAEAARRESRGLGAELAELKEEAAACALREASEAKQRRRLEADKAELQTSVEEAEAGLATAEAKATRLATELAAKEAETRRIAEEKEEEFAATRRNHARTLESLQVPAPQSSSFSLPLLQCVAGFEATLDSELRAKAEAIKARQRAEAEVGRLELEVDGAGAAAAAAQAAAKEAAENARTVQAQLEAEAAEREGGLEATAALQRRINSLQAEKADLAQAFEAEAKHKKLIEGELEGLRCVLRLNLSTFLAPHCSSTLKRGADGDARSGFPVFLGGQAIRHAAGRPDRGAGGKPTCPSIEDLFEKLLFFSGRRAGARGGGGARAAGQGRGRARRRPSPAGPGDEASLGPVNGRGGR